MALAHLTLAIDGPTGAGKTALAEACAARLRLTHQRISSSYQHRLLQSNGSGSVITGRNTTTVVLPEADLRVFLIASIDERLCRLTKRDPDRRYTRELLEQQDARDCQPELGLLRWDRGVTLIDNSYISVEEEVQIICELYQCRPYARPAEVYRTVPHSRIMRNHIWPHNQPSPEDGDEPAFWQLVD